MTLQPIRDMFPDSPVFYKPRHACTNIIGFSDFFIGTRVSVNTGNLNSREFHTPCAVLFLIMHVILLTTPSQMIRVVACRVVAEMATYGVSVLRDTVKVSTDNTRNLLSFIFPLDSRITSLFSASRPVNHAFFNREFFSIQNFFKGFWATSSTLIRRSRVSCFKPFAVMSLTPASGFSGLATVFYRTRIHREF